MSKIFAAFLAFGAAFSEAAAFPSRNEMDLIETRSSSTNYSLFAYGSDSDTEIGGFPIVYYGGSSCISQYG